MQTAQYYWKHLIWHPVDVADRILLLVGAVFSYFERSGSGMSVDLAWQIPLGTIGFFLAWRLLNLPIRVINDIRQAREGTSPPTLDSLKIKLETQQQLFEEIKQELKALMQENIDTRKDIIKMNGSILKLEGQVRALRGEPLRPNSGRSH